MIAGFDKCVVGLGRAGVKATATEDINNAEPGRSTASKGVTESIASGKDLDFLKRSLEN